MPPIHYSLFTRRAPRSLRGRRALIGTQKRRSGAERWRRAPNGAVRPGGAARPDTDTRGSASEPGARSCGCRDSVSSSARAQLGAELGKSRCHPLTQNPAAQTEPPTARSNKYGHGERGPRCGKGALNITKGTVRTDGALSAAQRSARPDAAPGGRSRSPLPFPRSAPLPAPLRSRLLPAVSQRPRLRPGAVGHVCACRRSRRRNGAVSVGAGRLPAAGRPPAPRRPRVQRAAPGRLQGRPAAPRQRGACLEECKLDKERIEQFCTEYQKNRDALEELLGSIGRAPPHVTDVSWRLGYRIQTHELHRAYQPTYLLTLSTENSDAGSQTDLSFSCTMEQLQDLVGKLKDAAKSLERATQL
uniref:COMM domain-containing protein 3 n=1 Tax=Coturnix japonica TaxID=93934 RepID=A0A8C2SUL8_COTJA